MAKQRMVNTRFWSDPWVVDELNPLDRYLFLYLLTNEKTNVAGVYEMSLRTMSNETGLEKEELSRMLKRLESRVVFVDGWVVLRKAIAHQAHQNPKIIAAIARELKDIPKEVLQFLKMPVNFGELLLSEYGIDTLSIAYPSAITPNLTKLNLTNTKPNLTKPASSPTALPKAKPAPIDPIMLDEFMAYWQSVVGFELGNELSNRRAIAALLRKYDKATLQKLIDGVAQSHDDQYAPRISDFVSLKRKVNDLLVWGRKRGKNNKVVEIN